MTEAEGPLHECTTFFATFFFKLTTTARILSRLPDGGGGGGGPFSEEVPASAELTAARRHFLAHFSCSPSPAFCWRPDDSH